MHISNAVEFVTFAFKLNVLRKLSTITVTLRSTQQTAPLRNDERNVNSENEHNGEKESVNGEKESKSHAVAFFQPLHRK